MNRSKKNQCGAVAILFAVLVLGTLLVIGLGIGALMMNQIKTMRTVGFSVEALYAADAGAENCLYQTRKKTGDGCDRDEEKGEEIDELTLDNEAHYAVDKYTEDRDGDSIPEYYIESLGQFQTTNRKIELGWTQ